MIGERTRNGGSVEELAVKQFVLDGFAAEGLFTDHGPIVGVNANASNPHYEPMEGATQPIRAGDFVLIDMWAKLDQPGAVYYDITWTGYCGAEPPAEMRKVFGIVRDARDRAIERVQKAVRAREALRGFEVDDAARGYIASAGIRRILSRIARATRSARMCTGTGRTWTTWRRTMSGGLSRGRVFRSSRESI